MVLLPKTPLARGPSARLTKRPAAPARAARSSAPGLRCRRILLPIDFSAAANAVLAAAIPWCERLGAEIHLVHVYSVDYPAPALMAPSFFVPAAQIAEDVRAGLRGVAQDHGLDLKKLSLHACAGQPYEEICRLARELEIDLIISATRGRTGLKHLALGSTAERIIRYAPCPVLVVHPPPGAAPALVPKLRKILVPTDFSSCAGHGLAYARALAARFGARLILLHSVDLHYYSTNPEYILLDLPPVLAAAEKAGREQLQELVAQTDWQGLKVEQTLESGHAGEEVCRRARELQADLIVTSTHGRTGLKHIFLGSTAEYIVRHATCPVLVVPSHARPALRRRRKERR